MNHTKNYNLPQWELNDLIRMEDFNSMNASIESGLTTTAARAETAAATAENARRTAVSAFSPANMPYTVGSYTGDGTEIREFSLGFQPRFLIICSSQLTYSADGVGKGMAMAGPSVNSSRIYLTQQGFRLESTDTVNIYPEVNRNGTVYNYIAFR